MFKILIKESYILVKFTAAVDYDTVMIAVRSVMGHEQYKDLNDIFVFEDIPVFISHERLQDILHEVENIYPENATRRKTALVITTEFGKVLARMWIDMARSLPPEIEIFSDLENAERWILA